MTWLHVFCALVGVAVGLVLRLGLEGDVWVKLHDRVRTTERQLDEAEFRVREAEKRIAALEGRAIEVTAKVVLVQSTPPPELTPAAAPPKKSAKPA